MAFPSTSHGTPLTSIFALHARAVGWPLLEPRGAGPDRRPLAVRIL